MRRYLGWAAVALACAGLASSAQAATVRLGQLFATNGSCADAATTPDLKFKVARQTARG